MVCDMSDLDTSRLPLSDIGLEDLNLLSQYNSLMDAGEYSNAVSELDINNFTGGIRASVFNDIKSKMELIEIYLLNSVTLKGDYYSYAIPRLKEFGENNFWIQPITTKEGA